MEQAEKSENVNDLIVQFSKLGIKISWIMCNKVIEDIKNIYPNVPKEEFFKIASNAFEEKGIVLDLKMSSTKSRVKEENRCSKILQIGKNQGKNCSLPRTKGSEFCKRHLGQIFSSSVKDTIQQSQIKKYLSIVQPKAPEIKNPVPMKLSQYGNENMFMETETKIIFRKTENGEYVAYGAYVQDKGVKNLSQDDRDLCDINSWKY
jgi:hypothetical protein